jgi:hypothetical protein
MRNDAHPMRFEHAKEARRVADSGYGVHGSP